MSKTYTRKEVEEIVVRLYKYLVDLFFSYHESLSIEDQFGISSGDNNGSVISRLEGKIKTQIEALISNENQCKAAKDVFKNILWSTTREEVIHIARSINRIFDNEKQWYDKANNLGKLESLIKSE